MADTQTTFRPLRWTEPSTPAGARRSSAAFTESWSNTLDLLDAELCYLDAQDLIIEADFREDDILPDGMPCTSARPPVHPGVRISFQSRFGPLAYSTDSCQRW
ncbi:MAG TPA: hypothetical protein VES02_10655, partial [Dermatophilaceae bacterium]|nr:hypothetical protein [Dermatophilaceae bacterium]